MPEFFYDAGEECAGTTYKKTDSKSPNFPSQRLARVCNGLIGGSEDSAGILQEMLAMASQANAPVLPIE